MDFALAPRKISDSLLLLMKSIPGALYAGALRGAAAEGNKKARAMLAMRRQQDLPQGPFDLWIHAASLGEYLMAKPLIARAEKAKMRVLVTFFSTSGCEIAQREVAHFAFIPLDRQKAIQKFLAATQPRQALFMKYDLWPLMTDALRSRQIPYSVAFAQVKPGATKLWAWNPLERPMWAGAKYVFHQTLESLNLWSENRYENGLLSGDGRFDQVGQQFAPDMIRNFTDFRPVLVVGSSWHAEEALVLPLLMQFPVLKVILAPHDLSRVEALASKLPVPHIRWSKYGSHSPEALEEARVMIVDTMGDLPALYACGTFAFVGGAFGPGLHNILEALAHGLPVVCGPRVKGHWEATHPDAPVHLLPEKAVAQDLGQWLRDRLDHVALLNKEKAQAKAFIAQHRGASQRVWDVLHPAEGL